MQRKRVNDIKATISEMFDLPKDIVLDLPKIIMVGGNQILVENHKGIIEYTPDRIRINSSIGVIRVLGANMMLKNIGQDDIMVTGTIKAIELLSLQGSAGLAFLQGIALGVIVVDIYTFVELFCWIPSHKGQGPIIREIYKPYC